MTTILDKLNTTRITTITEHYDAVLAELKAKITLEPLRTIFNIHSGCPSRDVADEVAHRLNAENIKTKVVNAGWFVGKLHLAVEVSLPEQLLPKKEEKKEEEKKEEEKKEEEKKEEVTAVTEVTPVTTSE